MELLIRVVITVAIIWLTQVLLDALSIQEPARKIIFVVVVLIAIVYLVTGGAFLRLN